MEPIRISFEEILKSIPWNQIGAFSPKVVVGIERGGSVLAALVAFRLNTELLFLRASFYDDSKPAKKIHSQPIIQTKKSLEGLKNKRVLLIDDVCKTGSTLTVVKNFLIAKGVKEIKTFVYAGKADFFCRPFANCLLFPWGRFYLKFYQSQLTR